MNLNCISLIYFFLVISICNSYRIFAIFPFKGKSHFSVMKQIVQGLTEKGHQVDVISGFQLEKTFVNYNNDTKVLAEDYAAAATYHDVIERKPCIKVLHQVCRELCSLLGEPEILRIIKNPPNDPPYDLVLIHFLAGYQCFTAIGHLWNVPVVGVVTTATYTWTNHFIENPLNLAIAPRNTFTYKDNMNFWERLYNFLGTHYVINEFYEEAYKQDNLIKKYLGPNVPSYTELEKSTALILANSHHSFHGVFPKSPALIEIGGIHIKNDNSTLKPELKKLLDESEDGFIYFSFGSMIIIESFPKEVLGKFYTCIRKIAPIRVIMKLNAAVMPKGMPDNVFGFPWLPQQKILQHPKIRGFVSHGGGLGTQEAVYNGVPIICVPFFADQFVNCDIIKTRNIGLPLHVRYAKQEDYDYVFNELVTNTKYRDAARKLSVLYRDRPMEPKQEAVYWLEYVMRHGKNVLKSPAVNLKWWQIELLDVYAFIAVCITVVISIVIFILRRLNKIYHFVKHTELRWYEAEDGLKLFLLSRI